MNTHNFNRAIIATAVISVLTVSSLAQAGPRAAHESLVQARVVGSEPVYDTINEPRTECWSETVGYDSHRSHRGDRGGAVIGAIAGGLIGSTVGKGNGRIAAAAIGAATGAVIGDRASNHAYASEPRHVERCETKNNYRRVLSGYDVRYFYQGREYSTQLPYDPGRYVNLRITVAVADEQRDDQRKRDQRDRDD